MQLIDLSVSLTPPPPRQISIIVEGKDGNPATGAVVLVLCFGKEIGTITVGSTRSVHTVLLRDFLLVQSPIAVKATFQAETRFFVLGPSDNECRIVFSSSAPYGVTQTATVVQCPDGTQGYPCVDCPDARICA